MLDRSDAAFLLVWLGTSLMSLAATYFLLKSFGWSESGRRFSDAWRVWLVWLVSSYLVLPLGLIVVDKLRLLSYGTWLPLIFLISGFLIGWAAIFAQIRYLGVQTDELIHLRPAAIDSNARGRPLIVTAQQALATNLVAWTAAIVGMIVAGIIFNAFEYFFPQQNPFGIYDIL